MGTDQSKQSKLIRLRNILSGGKRMIVFNHFNPDPDSLSASLILEEIAKFFRVATRIVYTGKIAYKKNQAMMEHLKLKCYPYQLGEEKKFDLIATVDTQKGMNNNSISEEIIPHLTFDHHPRVTSGSKQGKNTLYDIRTHYGSAATILLEYFLDLGLKMTTRIASAYCYAIIAETNHFTRKYNENDIRFYRQAVQIADLRLVSKIENTKRPKIYFDALKKVLSTYKRSGSLVTCSLGEISNLDFLHEIANFMLTMEEVDFVAITGSSKGNTKICCRSNNNQIHLGNILKHSLQGIGSGGGHETMAAGEFHVDEKKVISEFESHLATSISKP